MKKKIVLYYPATSHERFYSFFWIPYSILSIARVVYEKYDVVLIDDNLKNNKYDFYDLIQNCLCVGISSMIGHQIEGGLDFARKIRMLNPKIPIIWGGSGPSILSEIAINNSEIDIIVKGRGEITFSELVECLEYNNDLRHVKGIIYKYKNTVYKNHEREQWIQTTLPPMPWHLLNVREYINCDNTIGTKILNYVSSQGCPFQCGFCSELSIHHGKWFSYGYEQVTNDIDYLINNIDNNSIKFYDANFFGDKKIALKMAEYMFAQRNKINWAASGHPKLLDSLKTNEWELLSKSNLKRILIGAESGSQKILDMVNKKITPDTIISLVKKCSDHGIAGGFTFIVGFPNSSDDKEIEKTLELGSMIRMISTIHDVKIHFYVPYPGTPLYKKACENGFYAPQTFDQWSNFDYYLIETPWMNKNYEKVVHEFNIQNCPYIHL